MTTAGIALEQHGDRTQLFMQWKQMDWPVAWDPFNVLDLSAVPVTVLVDPGGTVLLIQPLIDRLDEIEEMLPSQLDRSGSTNVETTHEPVRRPADDAEPAEWGLYAVDLATWGKPEQLDAAVEAASRAVEDGEDPDAWFRLGVVHRMRYDSALRRSGDFADAVSAWTRALELDPNNYIWRRRLQQYGPRLAKPYPFYDWVPIAREEIRARGESPVPLASEPGGAEFAEPSPEPLSGSQHPRAEPDPERRVTVDGELIQVDTVLIPPVGRPGETTRAHLILEPNAEIDAHWNNEAGLCEVWLDQPGDWVIDSPYQTLEPGPGDVSDETRHVELEIGIPEDAPEGRHTIDGYALYYACEGRNGVCVYRRHDLTFDIQVDASAVSLG